jgi:hypothetical protein
MPQPNQLHVRREDVNVTAADLLNVRGLSGGITEKVGAAGSLCTAMRGFLEDALHLC